MRLPGGRIDLDQAGPGDALHVHGRFWPGHGRGTIVFTAAALTPEEEATICTSGELDWEMARTGPKPIASVDASELDGVMRVRVTEDRDLRVRIQRLEP